MARAAPPSTRSYICLACLLALSAGCQTLPVADSQEEVAIAALITPKPIGVVLGADSERGFITVLLDSWISNPNTIEGPRVTFSTDGLLTGTIGDPIYHLQRVVAFTVLNGSPNPGDNLFALPEAQGQASAVLPSNTADGNAD